jgi:hypothetical protein
LFEKKLESLHPKMIRFVPSLIEMGKAGSGEEDLKSFLPI